MIYNSNYNLVLNPSIIPTENETTSTDSNMNTNYILIQMLQFQRKNLIYKYKLELLDIKRIISNLTVSPFNNNNECCIWNGYVTTNYNKISYINFYFKHHKMALHRLLYINYIGDINNKQYLKFTCNNKGICCNLKHITKCIDTENEKSITDTPSSNIQFVKLPNVSQPRQIKFIVVLSD